MSFHIYDGKNNDSTVTEKAAKLSEYAAFEVNADLRPT